MEIVETTYYENVVNKDILDELVSIYHEADSYDDPNTEARLHGDNRVHELLKQVPQIDVDRIAVAHFYKHYDPYFVHTDWHGKEKENFVLPIAVEDTSTYPNLVVYDQLWMDDGRTWVGEYDLDFTVNRSLKGAPGHHNIVGNTNMDIDKDFYDSYLGGYPLEMYYGLSGKSYPFIPGNLIKMDTRRLHSTGKTYSKWKLGLTIRLFE